MIFPLKGTPENWEIKMGVTTILCVLPNHNIDAIRGFIASATKEGQFVVDVNSEGT